MRIVFLISFITLISINPCVAQLNYTWVFGDSAAIKFINNIPVPVYGTKLYSGECSCSISDTNGDLQFYAGANVVAYGFSLLNVYNKYNEIIFNGNNINGHSSSAQGCIIFPYPEDTNKLILLSHSNLNLTPVEFKIYYSIIDKNSNSDSGAVILKNVPLPGISQMSEHMQIVRHGNGKDWWFVTHKFNSNQFYKYIIDSTGIAGPFIQSIGNNVTETAGTMKLSPDGNKLVVVGANGIVDLYAFDRCTGMLSNWIPLGFGPGQLDIKWASSFSNNSKILYVSDADTALYQFDLEAVDIMASRQTIWVKPPNPAMYIGHHLLGPNGKIYIANLNPNNMGVNIFNIENMNLSVITKPDSLGLACDFQPYSFNLGGRRSFAGLPNMPDYSLGAIDGCDTVVSVTEIPAFKDDFTIFPNPSSDFITIYIQGDMKSVTVSLLNVLGKEIFRDEFKNETVIDVSQFSKGIYFLELTDNIKYYKSVKKIVIQ